MGLSAPAHDILLLQLVCGQRSGYGRTMTIQQKIKMTAAQFRDWAMTQPQRYELVDGEPVAMAAERAIHNRVKYLVCRALDDAVRSAGVPCDVFTDGMSVVVPATSSDGERNYEPDAAVQCGVVQDMASMVLPAPTIVVEVSSPSTSRLDAGSKLTGYARVASIAHYLIVVPEERSVIHHRRRTDAVGDSFHTTIHTNGTLTLDPPGLTVDVAALFPPAP